MFSSLRRQHLQRGRPAAPAASPAAL